MDLTPADAWDALARRDRRYDGLFFVGVTSTGIYCRPVCPARTPARPRCEFFATAALAEREGYRPCLRCRPEHAPNTTRAPADATAALLDDALRALDDLPPDDDSLDALAARLGVSARHLRRVFVARLGVTPVALRQSRRLALATRLLRDTSLSVTEVAHASGFKSLRRFHESLRTRYGRTPAALRGTVSPETSGAFTLRLEHRPPLDWDALLTFLRGRAIPGVERVTHDTWSRVIALHGHVGAVHVTLDPARPALLARCTPSLLPVLSPLVPRLRAVFDLDARPDDIARVLSADPALAPSVRARPGLRVPGGVSAFDLAVRTVLGQQVSVAAASTLCARVCDRFGAALPEALREDGLWRRAPTPDGLRDAPLDDLAACGLPRSRAGTLRDLGACFAAWGDALPTRERFVATLRAVRGIGEWTVQYLAMRAWHDPDAFPAGDLALRRALGVTREADALARAEAWRPYRAYATLHLWSAPPAPSGDP